MSQNPESSLLEIKGLDIVFPAHQGSVTVVKDASLSIGRGQIHAVVGESGSGKTMVARAILGLLPSPATIARGDIEFEGVKLTGMDERGMRKVRGSKIGMIFQDPLVSLNPTTKIRHQLFEGLKLHTNLSEAEIRARALELLRAVRINDPEGCLERYPHEFSGGMRQRIMIASAMMLRPALLLADEPTTALDTIVQKEVLDTMRDLARDMGVAILLISHDLGLVAKYADYITVMERGMVVESGVCDEILSNPRQPYTRKLLNSLPQPGEFRDRDKASEIEKPLLAAENLNVQYVKASPWPFVQPTIHRVVHNLSLTIGKQETLGLVGESGSGKSTLGRALIRLKDASSGRVTFEGSDVLGMRGENLRQMRRRMQIVFQDPYSSLDPRMRVSQLIAQGLRHTPGLTRAQKHERVAAMLSDVGLGTEFGDRFPHQLSGGQRQRVAIARALISGPSLVVADEPVSALDVTVQAQILQLWQSLRAKRGFSCLFISHDLGVVQAVCDRTLVMYKGWIVENAATDALFENPQHPYTRRLLDAAPGIVHRALPRTLIAGEAFDPDCHSQTGKTPSYQEVRPGHLVACIA